MAYIINGLQFLSEGYEGFFESRLAADGESVDELGTCSTSQVRYEAIVSHMEAMPQLVEDGLVVRDNALGLLRLNDVLWPHCQGQEYCGITVGARKDVHERVRPLVEEVFGDGSVGGDLDQTSTKFWNRATLVESAKDFLSDKNRISIVTDAKVWVAMQLHQIALGISLSEDEARNFVDIQGRSLTLALLPGKLVKFFRIFLGVDDVIAGREAFVARYEDTLRQGISSGRIQTLKDQDDNVELAAWSFFDAFQFAGGLSVPSVIQGGLGAYFTGLAGNDFNINDSSQASLLALESIRMYPPVLGFPYIELSTGHRFAPLVGYSGMDKSVFGEDANEFRIRGDLNYYKKNLINWADRALPVDGVPTSNFVCPAKSLSYNMILAFWEAMSVTEWCPDPTDKEGITVGNGPNFWSDFKLIRSGDPSKNGQLRAVNSGSHLEKCPKVSDSNKCGPEGPRCSREHYELKTVNVDDLVDANKKYHSDLGPRVATSSSGLPSQLLGVFWLSFNGGDSALVSFAKSNDGGGLSSGSLQDAQGLYPISCSGDRTWSFSGQGISFNFCRGADLVYNFRFDSAKDPKVAGIEPHVRALDLVVPTNPALILDMTLLSEEEASQAGYEGSVVWERNSRVLGFDLDYLAVQVVDGDSNILPAFSKFLEFANESGGSPGFIHYFETKKENVSPLGV